VWNCSLVLSFSDGLFSLTLNRLSFHYYCCCSRFLISTLTLPLTHLFPQQFGLLLQRSLYYVIWLILGLSFFFSPK
jgi:hypothetical protein